MRRYVHLFKAVAASCALAFYTIPAHAQDDREEILSAVQSFFDAMETRDTALLRSVTLADGQFHFTRNDGDSVIVGRSTFADFVNRLATMGGSLLERMWEQTVLQHGPIAVVWTPYDFYRNGTMSHCGVDVFTLVRRSSGWRISGILYTVEPTNCPPSPLGPPGG